MFAPTSTRPHGWERKNGLKQYSFRGIPELYNLGVRYGWRVNRPDFRFISFKYKGKQMVIDREALERISRER